MTKDMTEKEKKLKNFAKSVIDDPVYKKEIEYLLSKLNLTEIEVIQAYVDYDMDVFAYENEIYEPMAMRVVLHLHNLLVGSWHQDRQRIILEMVKNTQAKSIVDVGFGVPTKYVREYVLKNKDIKLTLVDLYDSALIFSEALFDYLDPSWKERITLQKYDMNSQEFIGEFDCYIFQDSIEHTKDPTSYLSKTVKLSPSHSEFVLSLPIGSHVPVHYIVWETKEEAEKWLNKCGLEIIGFQEIRVDPGVDLFAEQLKDNFYNIIVRCKKKN